MSLISRKLNPNRSFALDVFRGLTLAGMILVNNPGGHTSYEPLEHAAWNGWTPTDLVFPSFAFILGVAVTYSLANRSAKKEWAGLSLFDWAVPILGILMYVAKILVQTDMFRQAPKPPLSGWDLFFLGIIAISILLPQLEKRACEKGGNLYLQVIHHGFLIFAVGFIWSIDPTNPSGFRIMGVLHRLGLVYLFAGLIVLSTDRRGQMAWAAGLLAFYWVVMKYVPVPGCSGHLTIDCNMAGYIDNLLMKGHLYRPNWDPEGLLHTIPAIATGLLGCLTGEWLRREKTIGEKMAWLLVAGSIFIFAGLCLNHWFPINKNMWTPSYVLFCAGIDMVVLSICVWFVDFKGINKAVMPFVVLGSNSIFIYLISGTIMHYLDQIPAGMRGAEKLTVKSAIYYNLYDTWLSPCNASLAMALSYVAVWMLIGGIFYRKKIFFKL